jgi:ATPase family AAA domain-containing protein 3A/B
MDYKLQRERESLQVADQLARRRDEDKQKSDLEMERMKAALRQRAEEELQAERRRSDEHKARLDRDMHDHRAEIERKMLGARAVAEAEGRIKEQRENEDLHNRRLHLKAVEDRATQLESIAATIKGLGDSLSTFILDTPRVTATVVTLTALAAGVYGMREGSRVAAALLQKRLLTPPLVRETSRSMLPAFLRSSSSSSSEATLAGVVLNASMAGRVQELATSVRNTRSHGANFRNLLFFGPPGTGKTLVAKRLARSSGLDFAVMSGGDVGPLGKDAVTELHRLLDWASSSSKGCVLFIDEADAFLASRSRTAMSEEQRNALNALLYRTGSASRNLMLVLATNRPGDLDGAVLDRMDESLLFDLPDATARRALVSLYFEELIVRAGAGAGAGTGAAIAVDAASVTSAYLDTVADRLAGYSGRAISKLFLALQGTVYGRRDSPVVNKGVVEEVLARKLREPGFGEFQDFAEQRKRVKEPELR